MLTKYLLQDEIYPRLIEWIVPTKGYFKKAKITFLSNHDALKCIKMWNNIFFWNHDIYELVVKQMNPEVRFKYEKPYFCKNFEDKPSVRSRLGSNDTDKNFTVTVT